MASESPESHVWVRDIREEDTVAGCYLVRRKSVAVTRAGKPFMNLVLADRTGELEAKVWDRVETLSSLFQEGDVIRVKARAGLYRGQIQLTVSEITVPQQEADPAVFLESTSEDLSKMMLALRKILNTVGNPHLKALNDRFLADRTFVSRFRQAPAAKNFHHNYLGGLLEHTLSVCGMADLLAGHYPQLDRDLLVSGAFLHDIGKIREFGYTRNIDYTDEGRLLGHVVLGVAMVEDKLGELKDFPPSVALRLTHMILSHHGEYEFGSPKRPKFLEAFALHLLDDLDAKINGLGRFMEKDRLDGDWTDFNRMFGRFFLKTRIPGAEKTPAEGKEARPRQGSLFSPKPDESPIE